MYTISVTTTFRAGHQLKCRNGLSHALRQASGVSHPLADPSGFASMTEPYHIHDWTVQACVGGKEPDDNGLLYDFNKLKKILDEIVGPFSDRKLEDFKCFENMNTSAENTARYIYDSIKDKLPKRIGLLYVEVTETPGCRARYGEKLSV